MDTPTEPENPDTVVKETDAMTQTEWGLRRDVVSQSRTYADAVETLKAMGIEVSAESLRRWCNRQGVSPLWAPSMSAKDQTAARLRLAETALLDIRAVASQVGTGGIFSAVAIGRIQQLLVVYEANANSIQR